ncbi:MAG: TlpA disulfide reductase family protein, partial [Ginsengibacter sp.]
NKTPRQNDYTLLWIEPGKIQIKGKDSLKLANVKGSKAHNEWVKYFNDWTPYNKRKLILGEQLYNASKAGDKEKYNEVMNKRNELRMEERENLYKKYLLKNPNSPIAVHMLTKYAGDGSFYSLDEAWEMYNYLSDKNRNSEAGLHFLKRLEYAGRLNVGALALDFTQNDTLGNPISLSSFKGKYVLLDFWASWCAPCRDENPNVVNAFNQYKDKNFTVIGISLDQPGKHTAWMDAIHKDNLTWTQLSDLKGWGNEVAQLYGIGSIPQNFLLDPEGKIIAKNIRGEALLTTLEKFIK